MSFLKTFLGIKSHYYFCFCIILFQNLKIVSQIPIEDYVIYSSTWQQNSLPGDVEYFSHHFIKAVIHKVTQMVTKEVFLLQCIMKSPISVIEKVHLDDFEVLATLKML